MQRFLLSVGVVFVLYPDQYIDGDLIAEDEVNTMHITIANVLLCDLDALAGHIVFYAIEKDVLASCISITQREAAWRAVAKPNQV